MALFVTLQVGGQWRMALFPQIQRPSDLQSISDNHTCRKGRF